MPNNNPIIMRYDMRMEADNTAEVMVYGEITSMKWDENDDAITARDFDRLIKDAKARGAKKLNMRINSPGGSVYQAVAMKSMVENAGFDNVNVNIEGLCASAATLLCCVENTHVTIAEGSYFMIHNPSTFAWGTAKDIRKTADVLEKMEDDFSGIYAKRCKKRKSHCRAMMDEETWMTAEEAVENGFCDEIMQSADIAAMVMPDMMQAMKDAYRKTPGNIGIQNVSKANGHAPAASENKKMEEETMDTKELTMEQLRADNPELLQKAIMAGAQAERERIAEIDDLTPAGYEELAAEAKANGTSAMDYHKMIVKAQREKGAAFMAGRKLETAQADAVKGSVPDDMTDPEDEIKASAKEIVGYTQTMKTHGETMY